MDDRSEPPAVANATGPSIEHFEIERSIAKGGMAEVYEASGFSPDGERMQVCIKKILPHLTRDSASMSMFMDEARLASSLHHPNIVQVYDLCISQERDYFIVMEYVAGLDVSRLLRRARRADRPVPIPVAVRIVQEVCAALRYAHEKRDADGRSMRIIHRDISPQNILVARDGAVKLTDFGIAKSTVVMTTTAVGLLKGKYGYMSPEQARGEPVDHRSDLFNVGIILYELVTGRRCFKGESDFETLELMRNAVVEPPRSFEPGLSDELQRVILTALARHPRDRFQTADALERALVLCPGVHPCSREELAAYVETAAEPSSPASADIPGSNSLSLSSLVKAAEPLPSASTRPTESVGAAVFRTLRRSWQWLAAGAAAGALLGATSAGLARLDPPPGPATPDDALILIDSEPDGARVFLDGIELAHPTPVAVTRPRDARALAVRIVHPNGGEASDAIEIAGRELVDLSVDLDPVTETARSRAHLWVESVPRGEVYLDGRPAGASGRWVEVPADESFEVSVRAGEDEVNLRLELTPGDWHRLVVDLSDVWL